MLWLVQRIDGELVLSPTDLTKHLGCPHITTLDLLAIDGQASASAPDEALELIFKLGLAHEADYLQELRDRGLSVKEIESSHGSSRTLRENDTLEAMRAGFDVVYQATFYDGAWGGQADFLLRVDRPSLLGDFSYDIADTKLSRKLKVPALLQMATYAERLAVLQGTEPERLYVVTGDGKEHPWRLVDVAAFARRARARLRDAVDIRPITAGVPVQHCGQCRWIDRCEGEWRDQDDLSLVASMRNDHRETLRAQGIMTLEALAGCDPDVLAHEIGRTTRERLVQQARLQLLERRDHRPRYELLEPAAGMGLRRLPRPDEGDVYLDFEGDPFAESGQGREYLAGYGDSNGEFTAIWAHDWAGERLATIELVDYLLARSLAFPDMHIYHYAPYETTALKKLVGRHGVREAELDQLLRGERFVDLYAVVRQGIRISKSSYSIKKIEAFYWGSVRNSNPDVADAMSSVIAYERWSEQPDDMTLPKIEAYNRDDVRSTADLHRWLEGCRTELENVHGTQPRPGDQPADPAKPPSDIERAEIALAERLELAGQSLLAGLVQFHRREARPAYWEMFRLQDLDDEELIDDSAAVGGLSMPTTVGTSARSNLYRYEFPAQDTKLQLGDTAFDVDDHKAAGTVYEIDAEAGYVVLKRQAEARSPRGFTEKNVIGDQVIRSAIAAVAEDCLDGRPCLGAALLSRVVPRDLSEPIAAGRRLDGEVLAIQGPPGTGKTTVGAELVRALLDDGKRVGITANSHSVLGNLLIKIDRPAVQRCNEGDDFCGHPAISRAQSTAEVVARLDAGIQLVGGTAWLWSDPDLVGLVDVIVVDEAGQFSLANAVGVSRAATSMVLLGDPRQLSQPTRAIHPGGAGISALGHLLAGHDTIPPDRGVFLGKTWRMHPHLTGLVSEISYDRRLLSQPLLENQSVSGKYGLHFVGVPHVGNAAAAPEEVDVVAEIWQSLMAESYTDKFGVSRPMTPSDVLVVAPYNNQVGLLRQALPAALIGTVDKFQGKEAPVVIYSMTSSSADDAPRGVGFLYDVHRLNVAISRAKALVIVVLSPRLLDASVTTPEQLRDVNALCLLGERASWARDF
jgi:predicted RecB family nuclease